MIKLYSNRFLFPIL